MIVGHIVKVGRQYRAICNFDDVDGDLSDHNEAKFFDCSDPDLVTSSFTRILIVVYFYISCLADIIAL